MDEQPVSIKTIGTLFGLDGKQLQEQYVRHLSGFVNWDQLAHAQDWILFKQNLGPFLSIDETSLSQGELYTVVTNKQGKGRKGTLVAMVKGVESEKVIQILKKLPQSLRQKVKEITLDLAGSMERIARHCFPKARRVSDRFHVQQLAGEAVQELRIDYRWQAIEQENKEMELAKELGREHVPKVLANGDTLKQLLARSRYLLFKDQTQWTPSQHHRAEILFRHYPVLQKAYDLSRKLSHIFSTTRHKGVAFTRLAHWYNEVEASGLKSFNTLARTIQIHYATILNYFDNRATNAAAEAFNAKIKALRSQFRGVRNIPFFMFRLAMIYA